jgi:hypothetical protein
MTKAPHKPAEKTAKPEKVTSTSSAAEAHKAALTDVLHAYSDPELQTHLKAALAVLTRLEQEG